MPAESNAKKKPRARKLERDRAAGAKDTPKKTSSRHQAAKAAAKKKPAKKVAKSATQKRVAAGNTVVSRAPRAKLSDGAPSRRDASPARREARADRPDSRREFRSERADSRPVRADRRPTTRHRDEEPSRNSRRQPIREDRDIRGRATSPRTTASTQRSAERPNRRSDRFDREPDRFDDRRRDARFNDRGPAKRTERRDRFSDRPERAERTERTPRAPRVIDRPDVKVTKATRATHQELSLTWTQLGIAEELLAVLKRNDIVSPFPIQAATIPDAVAGRDVLGRGQTGSGKTLAFGLSMLTRLAHRKATAKHPLALVMVPTRELAMQVNDSLMSYAHAVGLDIRLVAGGMPYAKQIEAIKRGVPIVVATPGRLNDLIEQGHVNLSKVEITVLDEADQMCDMGFMPQIVEIMDLMPEEGQRLLFSATLDQDVDKIVRRYLTDPIEHATESGKASVSTMSHYLFVVHSEDKPRILAQIASRHEKTMFFARTQLGVERIANELMQAGVAVGALHGGKSQGARTKTLKQFKDGITNVLVATDVAARGIHVDGVTLVLHVDPPNDPKDYLHRAGRTARAGEAGAVATMVGPRQLNGVQKMTDRAGVVPEVVRVKPMSADLVRITQAQTPSGTPWQPPAEASPRRGRPPGSRNRSGAPRREGSRPRR